MRGKVRRLLQKVGIFMKPGFLTVYIICIVALFAWEEQRSANIASLVEHLYYLIPVCFCLSFGVLIGVNQRLQTKIDELEKRLDRVVGTQSGREI
ncbi:MAG: hypothetical protein ACJ8G1_20785 [Vitreoscilla sp.]